MGKLQTEMRNRTRMTQIQRIPTDIFNLCKSVLSAQSVFYQKSAFINRNFGLRSVGVCEAYPSFDKTLLNFCVYLRLIKGVF